MSRLRNEHKCCFAASVYNHSIEQENQGGGNGRMTDQFTHGDVKSIMDKHKDQVIFADLPQTMDRSSTAARNLHILDSDFVQAQSIVSDSIRVLLIEDNPDDAFLINSMLTEQASYNPGSQSLVVSIADRLSSAIDSLSQELVDVVLLDLGLPDSNGIETLQKFQAAAPKMTVVILTGFDDETFALQAVRSGAEDYLVKGQISPEILHRTIRYAHERRLTREALYESEERFRTLFQSAMDAIITLDNQGIITSWNQSAEAIFNYREEEMLGSNLNDIIDIGTGENHHNFPFPFKNYGTENVFGELVEMTGFRKDGSKFPIEISPTIWKSNGMQSSAAFIRDISERKRAESELKHSLDVERRQAAQIATELDLASRIQQAMLRTPTVPMNDLEILASWIPANEMSGDFYEFQPIDDHRLGVWVGDVSAKGVPAGLLMVLINAYLHAEMTDSFSPGKGLSQLNLNVSDLLSESEQFTTLFLGLLDTSNGMLTYSDAGHGHALIYHQADNTIEKLTATTPPLGIESKLKIVEKEVALEPADVLVIYSDGITEAVSHSGDFFGEQRLFDVINKHGQHSTGELQDAILTALEEFRQDNELTDDQTLLVVRLKADACSGRLANVVQITEQPAQVWTQFLTSHTEILQPLYEWVAMICSQLSIRGDKDQFVNACQLGISELVTNLIKHAYQGGHGHITVQAKEYQDRLEFESQDKGLAYEATPLPDEDLPILREGGYGLLVTQCVMDDIAYTRTPEGVNKWRLVKKL